MMDSSDVTEKSVILITGCSSGFGRLIAETMARKGYRVFATMRAVQDRNADVARELRALAERESLSLQVLEIDVTDDASVERAVDGAIALTGRIDILVNNAGYSSSRGDPQEVADCVVQLVEMPAGNRPLRVRVGSHVEAFSRLNDYSEQLPTEFLDAIGVTPLMAFQERRRPTLGKPDGCSARSGGEK
jgi:NAD(P)-dependent dehydrogenase (short-subunit alcohol dehydrogenase family)